MGSYNRTGLRKMALWESTGNFAIYSWIWSPIPLSTIQSPAVTREFSENLGLNMKKSPKLRALPSCSPQHFFFLGLYTDRAGISGEISLLFLTLKAAFPFLSGEHLSPCTWHTLSNPTCFSSQSSVVWAPKFAADCFSCHWAWLRLPQWFVAAVCSAVPWDPWFMFNHRVPNRISKISLLRA